MLARRQQDGEPAAGAEYCTDWAIYLDVHRPEEDGGEQTCDQISPTVSWARPSSVLRFQARCCRPACPNSTHTMAADRVPNGETANCSDLTESVGHEAHLSLFRCGLSISRAFRSCAAPRTRRVLCCALVPVLMGVPIGAWKSDGVTNVVINLGLQVSML